MTDRNLKITWAGLYVLCAGLGFVPNPGAPWVLTLFSLAFFLPPALLLYRGTPGNIRLVRWASIASLCLTLLMIVLNVLAVRASRAAGEVLHALLVVLTAPMVCSQLWALSIFCWACLLVVSLQQEKRK